MAKWGRRGEEGYSRMSVALLPALPAPEDGDNHWQEGGAMALLVAMLGKLDLKHQRSPVLLSLPPFPSCSGSKIQLSSAESCPSSSLSPAAPFPVAGTAFLWIKVAKFSFSSIVSAWHRSFCLSFPMPRFCAMSLLSLAVLQGFTVSLYRVHQV